MNWINVKDRLPEPNTYCWLYVKDLENPDNSGVTDGVYDNKCLHYISNSFVTAFRYQECCNLDTINNVTHWMEYYTPEPPNDPTP